MQAKEIKCLIESGLCNAFVMIEGDGAHFEAIVVSEIFSGKSRIERQQLVYDTVRKELMNGTLHALSVKTYTPGDWQTFVNQG